MKRSCLVLLLQIVLAVPLVSCRRPFSIGTMPSSSRRTTTSTAFVPSGRNTILQHSSSNHATIRTVATHLTAIHPPSSFNDIMNSNILLSAADINDAITTTSADLSEIQQLSPTTTIIVFIIGIIPFIWATYEFWRRIAVGASFGTGKDSVVIPSPFDDESDDKNNLIAIGEDNNPNSSRGRQTLDRGALVVAYVLFAVAGGSVAIAVASVIMGPTQPPMTSM